MLKYKSPYKHLFSFKTLADQRIYTKHQLFIVGIMEVFGGDVKNFSYFIKTRRFENLQVLRSPNKHKSAQFHTVRQNYTFNVRFEFLCGKISTAPVDIIRFLRIVFSCFENSLNYLTRVRIKIQNFI